MAGEDDQASAGGPASRLAPAASEPPIEPGRFDAIVVSTGLPEVLIASALAAAGKSVLLLDAQDYYGGAWASLSGQAFARLLSGGSGAGAAAAAQTASSPHVRPLPCHALPPLRATGVTTWDSTAQPVERADGSNPAAPANGDDALAPPLPPLLARCRALDLLPRALYQGEPLVDGLVAARAHPYVEFKLVEGSYVLDAAGGEDDVAASSSSSSSGAAAAAGGGGDSSPRRRLLRIPASKAHIFADRGLAPREKRALMRFLAAGLEAAAAVAAAAAAAAGADGEKAGTTATASVAAAAAAAAQGAFPAAAARSKEASSLVASLARRDVPLARVLRREGLPRRVRDFVLYGIAMACAPEEEEEEGDEEEAAAAAAPLGRRLSAADGRDALALYASSLGRFDAPAPPPEQPPPSGRSSISVAPPPPPPASAFMAATHGAGSLVEAFVRHAAVRGALTVLRRPVEALLLSSSDEGSTAVAGARLRAGGQELWAGAVVGGRGVLRQRADDESKGRRRRRRLARCVALLDGPLRPDGGGASAGTPDSFALLVAPPGDDNKNAAAAAVVRGLLLGPSAQAGPLSTPSSSSSSSSSSSPFLLYLVADVSHLDPGRRPAEDVLAPVLTRLAKRGGGDEGDGRPRVLEAVFYSQEGDGGDEDDEDDEATRRPRGLVVCPGPEEVAPGVAGYVRAWAAAEALYRRHFPGLAWFGEQQHERSAGEGGEEEEEEDEAQKRRRRDGGAGVEEEDGDQAGAREQSSDPPTEGLDAIDELSSALAALGEEAG